MASSATAFRRSGDSPPYVATADAKLHRRGHSQPSPAVPQEEDEGSLYWLLLVVGVVGVAGVLIRGGTWGAEPTVAAILCVFAARALVVRFVLRVRGRQGRGFGNESSP
jgi:hypothetical protein